MRIKLKLPSLPARLATRPAREAGTNRLLQVTYLSGYQPFLLQNHNAPVQEEDSMIIVEGTNEA